MKPRSLSDKKKILIVEDEPLIREVLRRYLGVLGYRVVACSEAKEARALAREELPDAVILDYFLPDMNGVELYRALLEDNVKIPAILTSAYELSKQDLKKAKELGIKGFLGKPFSLHHLKSLLHSLCYKRHFRLKKPRFFLKELLYNLAPRYLAKEVFRKVFREGLDMGGHVHFHVKGHEDHIILLCSWPTMGKVIAKSPDCGKGECIKWEKSSFANYDPSTIFDDLSHKINLVKVDAADYEMSWPTLADFLCWLQLSY